MDINARGLELWALSFHQAAHRMPERERARPDRGCQTENRRLAAGLQSSLATLFARSGLGAGPELVWKKGFLTIMKKAATWCRK